MGPVQVANLALMEGGSRVSISSFNQGTPQSNAAAQFYTPKTQALLRAAHWNFARRQVTLTLLKATVINGLVSADPPPQPFAFEYAWPPNCLKARFVMPTMTTAAVGTPLTTAPSTLTPYRTPRTGIPFVEGTDVDAQGNPIRVILTNLNNAILVYTADLSETPDIWDPLFLSAETAVLAAYFTMALERDSAQVNQQVQMAKAALDQARAINGSEAINSADLSVSWIRIREQSSAGWACGPNSTNGSFCASWDQMAFPNGLNY